MEAVMEKTDLQVIEEIKAGNAAAREELVRRYQKRVFNTAYGLTLDYNRAWDISQDALIKAINAIGTFRGESSFWTFVYRITMNAYYDNGRRLKVTGRVSNATDMEHDDGESEVRNFDISDTVSIEEDYEKKALKQAISTALNELTDIQRQVFMLKNMEGYKIREIADIVGISEGTVKSHLNRATVKVKDIASKGGALS